VSGRNLYLIGTAAPPVRQLGDACRQAIERGWLPHVVLTPTAASWVQADQLRSVVGVPVRVHPRLPDEQDPLPEADALLAAPLTFNTINKWAAGISDTLALGLLNELLSGGIPIVAAPCVKAALRSHPAYPASVDLLAGVGVQVLDPDSIAKRGEDGLVAFDWPRVLDSLNAD
jgi:phosphopantothenoylcysteine synthetase/decarboxylase